MCERSGPGTEEWPWDQGLGEEWPWDQGLGEEWPWDQGLGEEWPWDRGVGMGPGSGPDQGG